MPPPSRDPQAQVRYFIRLLAALCLQGGGDLTVDLACLRQIDEDGSRQALVEETDCVRDVLVLRYGSKHSAMYPVEPEGVASSQPQLSPASSASTTPAPTATVTKPRTMAEGGPMVTRPRSIAELAALEQKIRRIRQAAILKREQMARAEEASRPDELMEDLLRPPSR